MCSWRMAAGVAAPAARRIGNVNGVAYAARIQAAKAGGMMVAGNGVYQA